MRRNLERGFSNHQSARRIPVSRVMLITQSVAMGGMETHVRDLALEYVRRGMNVALVLPAGAPFDRIAGSCGTGGVEVSRIVTDRRQGIGAELRGLATLAATIHAFKPQAVHLHTGGATGGLAPLLVTRLCSRATTVRTEHDVPTEHPRRLFRFTTAVTDRLTGGLVAVSRRNAGLRAARLRSHRRFAVVLNGVPAPPLDTAAQRDNRESVRGELGVCAASTIIGSVVRLADGKGLPDLLQAFSTIESTDPPQLLLVGDGPLRDALTSQVEQLGIADRVHFAGQRDDVARYLDGMDVFVLAVPAGSMSIALLEAMARGVASVITFGGPEEAIIDGVTGLTSPPNDPIALAARLVRLLGDPEFRAVLAARGHEHVVRVFSTSRVAEELLGLYQSNGRGAMPSGLDARSEALGIPE